VNRRATPRERRDGRRRVADRSVAMRRAGSSGLGWLWLVLAIAGGVGGAAYYYSRRGFAPFAEAVGDSLAVPPGFVPPADSAARAAPPAAGPDSAAAQPPPVAAADSAPSARPVHPPPTSRPTPRPAAPPAAAAAATGDSGSVRLVGLPRGSTVMINERPVQDPVSRLPAGRHVLAVSAPRFQFFTDTIVVRAGDTLELTPALLPVGAPAASASTPPPPAQTAPAQPVDRCSPGRGYNAAACFDERPKPVEPPFVPLPEGIEGTPKPSQLWVKVSAEGRTVDIRRLRPSDDAAFEQAARDFAWIVAWHPAMKEGAPVEAWTQMLFPPQPQ
jgi:hypothetical protein